MRGYAAARSASQTGWRDSGHATAAYILRAEPATAVFQSYLT
jgi:hypothetical protein